MSFANPWLLLLFLPVAVAAWRLLRRGRRSGIRFSAVGRLPAKTAGWRAKVAALTPFVLLAGLSLLVVAAARPRTSLAREKKTVDAIAIAMAVDVSGSMAALDLTPKGARFTENTTRLAVVKNLFAQFVEKRPDDLIGLVAFGGYASTRSPLTADHAMLLQVLKGVQIPTTLDAQGRPASEDEAWTAIGDGLAVALDRVRNAKPKTKVVILLSDGDNNAGAVTPEEATAAAAKLGVKVYAIGVGTNARVVPFLARDEWGRPVVVRGRTGFDERQLRVIAKTTGGKYFAVNDRDSLADALEEIDQLETTKIDADVYNRWNEHFAVFLLLGALGVLVAVSLSMSAARRVA